MRRPWPPWWILALSAVFLICAGFLYFVVFFVPEPVGWSLTPVAVSGSEVRYQVANVRPQSAVARAGFETNDLILQKDVEYLVAHLRANTPYSFEIERRGDRKILTLTLKQRGWDYWRGNQGTGTLILTATSALYLILAGVLVFSRPQDLAARWGALLLAQLGIGILSMASPAPLRFRPELLHVVRNLPLPLGAATLLGLSLSVMVPAGAFGFFAVFPRTLHLSKRVWCVLIATAPSPVCINLEWFWLPVYSGMSRPVIPNWLMMASILLGPFYLGWALLLLARNYRRIRDQNERRRLRTVAAGFGITISAMAWQAILSTPWRPIEQFGYTHWQGSYLPFVQFSMFAVAPICTAYAILRHRMFDIRVMVRLGLQYAAARGLLLSLVPVIGVLLVLDLLVHGDQPFIQIAGRRGWLYLAAALGAYLLHTRRKVWLDTLDRRFYRERYDAQRILRSIVEDVRAAASFEQEAARVVAQVESALHPECTAILVREPGEEAYRVLAARPAGPTAIPAGSKLMTLVRVLGKPVEIEQTGSGWLKRQLPPEESEFVTRARLEWIFPISLAADRTEALIALGPKRSEEPYSREDRDLLEGITASLALLLERSAAPGAVREGFEECPQCGACYDPGASRCPDEGAKLTPQSFPRLLARRYRFERRLGRGGMGTVYEALDTELERRVAVKLMRPELMASADAISRFKREAKAAASFSHSHVVTVYDFGVAENQHAYLIMELLRGCSLRQELRRHGRLAPARSAEILRGACAAVEAAHRRGLLHRDLKPDNIFLAQAEGQEVAKILDFGLVKLIAPVEETVTLTETGPGVLVGTVRYMSPEQLRGEKPAESWDLWALAVIAYEMMTGTHPYAASPASEWPNAVLDGRMTPLNAHLPEAPASWSRFFERALATRVELRPASALQLFADFKQSIHES
jgi:hypothetical protein